MKPKRPSKFVVVHTHVFDKKKTQTHFTTLGIALKFAGKCIRENPLEPVTVARVL